MATTLSSFLKPLNLDPAKLTKLTLEFRKTFEDLAHGSDEQLLPTPITLPDQLQAFEGLVLAIDIGGSHLRVGLFAGSGKDGVGLVHGGNYQVIPEELKAGTAAGLFSFIGKHIVDVLQDYQCGVQNHDGKAKQPGKSSSSGDLGHFLPVGVTFSFPMIQHSIGEATLMPLGKGFTMEPGQRLDKLLLAGYENHTRTISAQEHCPVYTPNSSGHHQNGGWTLPNLVIKAITNDTIATLIAGRHCSSPDNDTSSELEFSGPQETVLGLILATGMNATLALSPSALSSTKTSSISLPSTTTAMHSVPRILINTELSIRGTSLPLHTLQVVTPWDAALDASTASPGFQPLEYMTSGRYLGELVRLIFVDWVVNVRSIPRKTLPPRLLQPWILTTEYLSTVVAVPNSPKKLAEKLAQDFPSSSLLPESGSSYIWTWTSAHAETLATIAQQVQIRSSRLIASACIALLLLSGDIKLKTRQSPQATSTPSPLVEQHEKEYKRLAIAYTGAVIEKYPMYVATCEETIDALFFSLCKNDDGVERIVLNRVIEGGLRGAAMLAVQEVMKEEQ